MLHQGSGSHRRGYPVHARCCTGRGQSEPGGLISSQRPSSVCNPNTQLGCGLRFRPALDRAYRFTRLRGSGRARRRQKHRLSPSEPAAQQPTRSANVHCRRRKGAAARSVPAALFQCRCPAPCRSSICLCRPCCNESWSSQIEILPVVGPPNSPVAHDSFSTASTGQMSTNLRPSHLINTERENRVQWATTPRRVAHWTLLVLAVAEHSAFKERRQPNAVISSGPVVAQNASRCAFA